MPTIPPGTAVVVVSYSCAGSTHIQQFTMGLSNPTSITPAGVNTNWRLRVHGTGGPLNSSLLGTEYTLLETKSTCNIGGSIFTAIDSTALTGTAVFGTVPPNAAFLLTKNTGIAGRRYRGRSFLPPAAASEGLVSSAGIIASGTVTTMNGLWATAYANLVSDQLRPALIHLDLGTWTLISSLTINSKVGTLKRRLRG